MGLKCSLLGHAFEPADIEREREEQGNEVVTVVRELERCIRCGKERVTSETTEVTAVVDADEVGLDEEAIEDDSNSTDDRTTTTPGGTGGFGGVADRAEASPTADDAVDDASRVGGLENDTGEFEARDPAEEDAEILTDNGDDERAPGEWPEESTDDSWEPAASADEPDEASGPAVAPEEVPEGAADDDEEPAPKPEEETAPTDFVEDSGSGITVPDGPLACSECGFEVDAESSYRDGDPCPECGAWLTTERNP